MNTLRKRAIFKLLLIFSLFAFSVTSCKNDDDLQAEESSVVLDVDDAVALAVGGDITVTPNFKTSTPPKRSYSWNSSTPGVVRISVHDDYSATISALNPGSTTIRFSSNDGEIQASFKLTVTSDAVDDGILKILAIGNSFSEDAIENYLYELAAAENISMVIGNLFIGGASLEQHWSNAQEQAAIYDYRKIDQDGSKTSTPNSSISVALEDEDWDYISFQQVSNSSGQYETFMTPLSGLVEYVKSISSNPQAKYILHQTWAYAQTSTHVGFANYSNNQQIMYEAIVDAYRRAKIVGDFDYVIPAGTAIQNGRSTFLGDSFTRDGYHLNLSLGRYTAASTWFEALTGINVVGNTFAPDDLNETEIDIAQKAAHSAILTPDNVTPLAEYLPEEGEARILTAPINLNFGSNSASTWNTLNDHHEGASISNLKDIDDEFTNISVTVTQRFNARNEDGARSTDTELNMPDAVSAQSYYGNFRGVWQNLQIRQSQLTFSGLSAEITYELCFFGSRTGVGDNRETKFTVEGENVKVVHLQTANNTSEIACVSGVRPNADGHIKVTVTAGDNNNNGSGFYYLSAMRMAPDK